MLGNILPSHRPSTPGEVSKGQILFYFLKVVMLHNIKSTGTDHRTPLLNTLDPWVGSKGQNSENGHVGHQIKGKEV